MTVMGWPIDRILITIQLLELGNYIGHHINDRWQHGSPRWD